MDATPGQMRATVERDAGVLDEVAVEEPLEIRVRGPRSPSRCALPARMTSSHSGSSTAKGLITAPAHVGLAPDLAANIVDVDTDLLHEPATRRFYATSSCGVCGKGALEEVAVMAPEAAPGPVLSRERLAGPARHPDRCPSPGFASTGGLHATGLFTVAADLLLAREDVGRHNAMDKVVGRALLDGLLPLHGHVLCVSGRLSFELVQKAALAGAPILVGVGAPTSLAIELARDRGMTLCGFARHGDVNVYAGRERVA